MIFLPFCVSQQETWSSRGQVDAIRTLRRNTAQSCTKRWSEAWDSQKRQKQDTKIEADTSLLEQRAHSQNYTKWLPLGICLD